MKPQDSAPTLYRRRGCYVLLSYVFSYGLSIAISWDLAWLQGGSLRAELGALLAPALLLAPVVLIMLIAAYGVYRGHLWGRLMGLWAAGLLGLLAFPYGFFVCIPLFLVLTLGWPPMRRLKLPRPVPKAPITSPAPLAAAPNLQAWNTKELRRFKRPRPRSR